MTTRIATSGPSNGVTAGQTASRVTPPPARPFQQMVNVSTSAVVQGAEATVGRLPGGPLLAAAFRGPGTLSVGTVPGAGIENRAEGSAGTALVSMPGASGAVPAGGASSGAAGSSTEAMLTQNADQNLYYLSLQERISAESRSYTALSNVLKARHDTVKNAIGNIR